MSKTDLQDTKADDTKDPYTVEVGEAMDKKSVVYDAVFGELDENSPNFKGVSYPSARSIADPSSGRGAPSSS